MGMNNDSCTKVNNTFKNKCRALAKFEYIVLFASYTSDSIYERHQWEVIPQLIPQGA